jgi:acyl carrier protein
MVLPTNAAEVQEIVRLCWTTVLEVPEGEVESNANFFEFGGDSLLAVELVAVLAERLGVEVPLEALLFDGTFAALAGACSTLALADGTP